MTLRVHRLTSFKVKETWVPKILRLLHFKYLLIGGESRLDPWSGLNWLFFNQVVWVFWVFWMHSIIKIDFCIGPWRTWESPTSIITAACAASLCAWYMSITCECGITTFGNQYTNAALYRVLYFTARTEGYFNPAKDILFASISEIGELGG